ncbi:MAG: phosphotransferase, partial [Synechococcus sp.]|nr:phosphotransferase [Synechococcus sp.]
NWAAFSLLKGQAIERVTPALLEGVAQFLGRLKAAGNNNREAEALPIASEACFSLEALEAVLTGRLNRLETMRGRGPVQDEAYRWCSKWLKHDHQRLAQRLKTSKREEAFGAGVARQERVLSPSDVGIHNMLQMDGGLGFMDFEYAGWDDPAKFTADWILQPDNPLGLQQALQLEAAVARQIGEGSWQERLTIVLEINRLKWCAIMLNMFLRGHGESAQDALSRRLKRTQAYFQESMELVSGFREAY